MWAVGRLSWQWQEQWVMTQSSVGKVKWREWGSERERESVCVEERRKENMESEGGEEEGKDEVKECSCGVARPDCLIGLANQAELTSGWGLWGQAENGKGAREALFPARPYTTTVSPTKTALKHYHGNAKKGKLNLFLDNKGTAQQLSQPVLPHCVLNAMLWLYEKDEQSTIILWH